MFHKGKTKNDIIKTEKLINFTFENKLLHILVRMIVKKEINVCTQSGNYVHNIMNTSYTIYIHDTLDHSNKPGILGHSKNGKEHEYLVFLVPT